MAKRPTSQAYRTQLRVAGRFASAVQYAADRALRVIAGQAKPLSPVSWLGTPKQRKQLQTLAVKALPKYQPAKPAKPVYTVPPSNSVEVRESYKESHEGSTRFNKRTPGAVYERHDGKGRRGVWKRTVYGRVNAYRWDFKTMLECRQLLLALNTQYDSYRQPGTLNRVVARIEVWYKTTDPHAYNAVSSPYDWIADVMLYTHSWEEKASTQKMLDSLDDQSRLVFTVELLLPDSAVEKFGEPD